MCEVELTAEARELLIKKGWDKGFVGFGFTASESTVRLAVAFNVLGKPCTWVMLSFDDKPLRNTADEDPNMITPGATEMMGVKSDTWKLLSGGRSCMPALCVDGSMFTEASEIVKMLAIQQNAPPEVLELIELSRTSNAILSEVLKHFGWSALHASTGYAMCTKEHYDAFGEGKKDAAWEKAKTDQVKAFFSKLEGILADKPAINGCYVGDTLTLADAALFSWPLSFSDVAGLNVSAEYPKLWENWTKLKESRPKGSERFILGFPTLCEYASAANKAAREGGFEINKYWRTDKDGRAYLEQFGVQAKLSTAVAIVMKERPANPIRAIVELLRQSRDRRE